MTRTTLLATALTAAALGLAADRAQAATPITAAVDSRILTVQGTAAAESVVVRLSADDTALEVDDLASAATADLAIARSRFDRIVVRMGGGGDELRVDDSRGPFTLTTPTVLAGQDGDDRIIGGIGAETILGDGGSDSVDGGPGDDVVRLGTGDDGFGWNPGDDSDVLDGQDGRDRLQFLGSDADERIDLATGGTRARLTRDVANVVMDFGGFEELDVIVRGGADRLAIEAAAGDDEAEVLGFPGSAAVVGLPLLVRIDRVDAFDRLAVLARGGNDSITASRLQPGVLDLRVEAGDGDDVVAGSTGPDVLLGGPGNDRVSPGRGDDLAFLGDGLDRLLWNPGDGSDVGEGQAGFDRLVFSGSSGNENVDISANGARARLSRDLGNIVMDLGGIEQIDHSALGGADTLAVHELTTTSVTRVTTNLASVTGTGDGQADQVIVDGTDSADQIAVAGSSGAATVTGLAATVAIRGAEGAHDNLTIRTLAGTDTVDSAGLTSGTIGLTVIQ